MADNVLFKEIAGEAGQQLGRDWAELGRKLATPAFEFGIIAGGKGDDRGYNPLLPGDNDGTISVETARLAGARDFAVLPVLHSFVMDDPQGAWSTRCGSCSTAISFPRRSGAAGEDEKREVEK